MFKRPGILGIVNITADSFSDGGQYLDPEAAVAHGRALREAGADILDLGPASSHPDACDVSPAEEIARLSPVLPILREEGARLSVDSFHPETQAWAIGQGVAFLNDIQGFSEPDFYGDLARADCRLIIMHSVHAKGKAMRTSAPQDNIIDHACRFFEKRLEALYRAGVNPERLVLDPGMGFFLGNTPEVSVQMLQGLERLKSAFRAPLLVSVSRKSFLCSLTGRDASGAGAATLAGELFAAFQGADYIRTHDAAALHDAVTVWEALWNRNIA